MTRITAVLDEPAESGSVLPPMPCSSEPSLLPALRRIVAAGSAALVLALAVFAVSPNAHAWIHEEDGHEHATEQAGNDSCAIVLFAGGVSLPLEFGPIRAPAGELPAASRTEPAELLPNPPRYLRQPERGPPGC